MRFAGYAAVFDRVDAGGDVVRAGAFARSLGRGQAFPLLWQHQAGQAIGRVEYVREDRRGLRVIGRVTDKRAAALLRERAVTGLSFGYRVLSTARPDGASRFAGDERVGEKVRELTELELVEVSLVNFPMQELARVHAVEES